MGWKKLLIISLVLLLSSWISCQVGRHYRYSNKLASEVSTSPRDDDFVIKDCEDCGLNTANLLELLGLVLLLLSAGVPIGMSIYKLISTSHDKASRN